MIINWIEINAYFWQILSVNSAYFGNLCWQILKTSKKEEKFQEFENLQTSVIYRICKKKALSELA